MLNTEVTRVCSRTNVTLKYNWHLNPPDNEAAIDLGLPNVKKYWKYAAQIINKLSHFYDFLSTLAIFVNEACINYN